MGEKIKDLKEVQLGKNILMLEKNKGTHGGFKYDIHLQNSEFRLNMTEKDFCRMACAIMFANENMRSYKKNNEGEDNE